MLFQPRTQYITSWFAAAQWKLLSYIGKKKMTDVSCSQTLRQWLQQEPFALALSSGFFGFFAHCGMLCALEEQGLTPNAVTGSSAGALVGGCWAAGLSAEALSTELLALQRKDFWDPGFGFGLLRGRLFEDKLREVLPQKKFSQCRVPLSVSVFELASRKTRILREGQLAPAIRASCCFPFLFQPVHINGRRYIDGGVADRPGLAGMPKGQRVLFHHLASRSPWRRKGSAALKIPTQSNMTSLVITSLPRVGPFRLEQGKLAFQEAKQQTLSALDQHITDRSVHVPFAALPAHTRRSKADNTSEDMQAKPDAHT